MDTWHIWQIHTRHRACTDDCTQVEFPSGTAAFLSARSQRLSRQTDCLPVKGYHGKTIENSWMWHWSCFLLAGASFYSLQKVKVKVKQRGPVQKATDSASALALCILKGTSPRQLQFSTNKLGPSRRWHRWLHFVTARILALHLLRCQDRWTRHFCSLFGNGQWCSTSSSSVVPLEKLPDMSPCLWGLARWREVTGL